MDPSSSVPTFLPKKKRGRPRKIDLSSSNAPASSGNAPLASKPKARVSVEKEARKGNKEGERLKLKEAKEMVGQSVDGVINGAFDAGYLVTIRIGSDEGRLYHGVVFGPELSIPVNRDIDIAPELTMVNYATQKQQILGIENTDTPDY